VIPYSVFKDFIGLKVTNPDHNPADGNQFTREILKNNSPIWNEPEFNDNSHSSFA
jgi:hypothetical protein